MVVGNQDLHAAHARAVAQERVGEGDDVRPGSRSTNDRSGAAPDSVAGTAGGLRRIEGQLHPEAGCPGSPRFRSRSCRPSLRSGAWRWWCPGRCRRSAGQACIGLLEGLEQALPHGRRDADAGVGHGEAQAHLSPSSGMQRTRAARTEPSSVNLTALPARLSRIWRRWTTSPRSRLRHVGRDHRFVLQLLGRAPAAAGSGRCRRSARAGENSVGLKRSLPASIAEMSSTSSTSASRLRVEAWMVFSALALLGVQARGRPAARTCLQAVERRAEFVAHVGQEPALGRVGAARLLGGTRSGRAAGRTSTAGSPPGPPAGRTPG